MQQVPVEKILIQPTVQYRWLQQHGYIEYQLPKLILERFKQLWNIYKSKAPITAAAFLNDPALCSFYLEQEDLMFALFTGAHYADSQESGFEIDIRDQKMVWRIRA